MARIKCPACGVEQHEADNFCSHCGTRIPVNACPVVEPASHELVSPAQSPVEPTPVQAPPSCSSPVERDTTPGARLVVDQNGRVGHEFVIDQGIVNIGRWDADNNACPEIDLSDDDPGHFISRRHARVFIKGGEYFLEDLGSTNGTYVNKAPRLLPRSPLRLQNGDEIMMGRTFFTFLLEELDCRESKGISEE